MAGFVSRIIRDCFAPLAMTGVSLTDLAVIARSVSDEVISRDNTDG